ncbi:hypothetical protein Patl1_37085 [Pistacia atlantica]|nr:hypothetical protein Patl1_37085 [Pistacia atlantica]
MRRSLKLSPRYCGPFQVLQRIGNVAYKLDLPEESRIHPVFHVSCLKKLRSHVVPSSYLPLVAASGALIPEPDKILQRRPKKKGNQDDVEVLIQWKGTTVEDATWEDFEDIQKKFP